MNNFLKSHTLLVILSLLLTGILSQQALKEKSCFEIQINQKTSVKAGNCIKQNRNLLSHLPLGGFGGSETPQGLLNTKNNLNRAANKLLAERQISNF